ncbi:3,4-dihydroxy-2-butanone-4-phosphate synthase [Psychromicrobium sp. YIM B11713]|uniref:3,4-dihydroxy-2-butanone-4-phosphate synthase n=1 Tax=Psychromicrobium sp. YIM B11713 TaxID=3145233 RepID=UPI00374F6F92
MNLLDPIEHAITAIAQGGAVIVVDDEDRENEGDIVFAAQHSTPQLMAWTIRHTSGVVCIPLTAERADALRLPPMTAHNEDVKGTAYTVSCDAREVTSTGISASDRSITAVFLADPAKNAENFNRPGHIFPLRAVAGGIRERRGHTEAAVELARLAGCEPVGVISEVVRDDGEMMRRDELRRFALKHGCPMISIADLADYLESKDLEQHLEAAR